MRASLHFRRLAEIGAERNPEWFRNLQADPRVTVEVDGATISAEAVTTQGVDRAALFAEVCRQTPLFAS